MAKRALGCPAAICRSRSSLRVHNGPSERRVEATQRWSCGAGSSGTAAVALAAPREA